MPPSYTKVSAHLELFNKKTWKVFQFAKILDPSYACKEKEENFNPEVVPFAKEFKFETKITEYFNLLKVCDEKFLDRKKNPKDFWEYFYDKLSPLSEFALRVLQIPTSSAEVERSFSIYKKCVSPQRSSLKDETIQQLIYISINFDVIFPNYRKNII